MSTTKRRIIRSRRLNLLKNVLFCICILALVLDILWSKTVISRGILYIMSTVKRTDIRVVIKVLPIVCCMNVISCAIVLMVFIMAIVNTMRPRQDGCHFADDIFKRIFLNENVWIPIKISLKFVPKSPINNIPALVHIMAWRRLGDKPLYETMLVSLLTHICVTRPQWVKRKNRRHHWMNLHNIVLCFIRILNYDNLISSKANSSDAREGIFWLIQSISCLVMPWLLKSPRH